MLGHQFGTISEDGPCEPDIGGIFQRLAPHLRSLEFLRLVTLTVSFIIVPGGLATLLLIWSRSSSLIHAIIFCFMATVLFTMVALFIFGVPWFRDQAARVILPAICAGFPSLHVVFPPRVSFTGKLNDPDFSVDIYNVYFLLVGKPETMQSAVKQGEFEVLIAGRHRRIGLRLAVVRMYDTSGKEGKKSSLVRCFNFA